MPKKCYYKPNRSRARVFTAQDIARISKYAINDGADPRDIAIKVIEAAGLGYLVCASAKAVNSTLTIATLLTKIGGALAVGKILDFLLSLVTNGLFQKIPVVRRYLAIVVLILAVSEGIIKAVKNIFDSAEVISGSAEAINDLCERGKALVTDRLP